MYIPTSFQVTDTARLHEFMRRESFAVLISQGAEGLIASHLRLVISIARRYSKFGLPVNDLVQEGTVGLIQAVRKFNPDRDARLATYAMWWVRAAIQDYVVRSWSLVRVGKTAAHRALFFACRKLATASTVFPCLASTTPRLL